MIAETPILIVGAGPSGLVAALTLLKNGVPVRVITNDPEHRAVGQRGSGVFPRTLELYNLLGILPDVLDGGMSVPPMRIYKLPGGVEPIKTFQLSPHMDPTPSIPYSNLIAIGQEHTEAILLSHLVKYGGHVELGTELRSIEHHSGCVVARVLKVSGGMERPRRSVAAGLLGQMHWHIWGDPQTTMVSLRPTEYNDDTFAFIATGKGIDLHPLLQDYGALVRFIHTVTNRNDLVIGEIQSIFDFRPNIRMVDRFGIGRGFVIGDAAHIHSPTGAQGVNSSVQDAVNLSWKLALVEKGIAPPTLLETYTEERLPVIAEMLEKTTQILNKTMVTKGDGSDVESAWDRSGSLNQLGVNYRCSSIVLDERAMVSPDERKKPSDVYGVAGSSEVRAGDRAPDAPGLEIVHSADNAKPAVECTSLFRIFGVSYHTVLLFTADVDLVRAAIDALSGYPAGATRGVVILPSGTTRFKATNGAEYVLVDQEGHAHTGYVVPVETSNIVIVRPDGVIGGIVLGVEGLRRYFGVSSWYDAPDFPVDKYCITFAYS
ncbi:Pentachlorophenol 4-monooxygenase [Grifola frondosa]|uniref:Pentachlorophenol 4-monooxygenase n=1 Tax=Grifola frondosa TaxID=5627 RepID=A0A1C7LS72_GRIFR|nr:Pentachlorophenol 4-monooxygenase [Grifola frondosa]